MRALAITGMLTVLHNFTNDARRGHARHASVFANVGGHAFEGHDGAGSRLFGDARLVGGGDVHDDAALEHFGQDPLSRATDLWLRCRCSHPCLSPDAGSADSVILVPA